MTWVNRTLKAFRNRFIEQMHRLTPRKVAFPLEARMSCGYDFVVFRYFRRLLNHSVRLETRMSFASRTPNSKKAPRKRTRTRTKIKKKDPLFVEGKRPRPMYVDYKDVDLLTKLVNRHGRIVGRRKNGCGAVSQHAIARAVKRARFMALMPFVGE